MKCDKIICLMLGCSLFAFPTSGKTATKQEPEGYFKPLKSWRTLEKDLTWEHPVAVGDVNGDERADVVVFWDDGTYVFFANSFGVQQFEPAQKWSDYYAVHDGWKVTEHVRTVADVDGDGLADVVGFGGAHTYVSLSNGNGFDPPKAWSNHYCVNDTWRVDRHVRTLADVNNDGAADIIGFGESHTFVSLSLKGEEKFDVPIIWTDAYSRSGGTRDWEVGKYPRMVANIDNDGDADIVGFYNYRVFASLSLPNQEKFKDGLTEWRYKDFCYQDGAGWGSDDIRILADVDNDGRADVIGFYTDGTYVSRSTRDAAHQDGYAFGKPYRWTEEYNSSVWSPYINPRMAADVNLDGRADIIGIIDGKIYVSLNEKIYY
ncbi:MAG: VCBS repeat-containing protein [Candidatus Electrothrix sp. AW3_4]|nr:VCBS repeat-containing protein [Candidatus Electrothrix gigas]